LVKKFNAIYEIQSFIIIFHMRPQLGPFLNHMNLVYLLTYLLTYLLHGAEYYLKS